MRTKAYLAITICVVKFWICTFIGHTMASQDYIGAARCQAHCLERFTSAPDGNEKCLTAKCLKCWNSCYVLFDSEYLVDWKNVCRSVEHCNSACQVACNFRRNMKKSYGPKQYEIHILEANSNLEKTVVEWNITSSAATTKDPKIIYILQVRNLRHMELGWTHHKQTSESYMEYRTEELYAESEIWIQAVGENGVIAEKKLTIDTMYDQPKTMTMPPQLDLSVKAITVRGKTQAISTWRHLEAPDNVTISYTLSWFRKDCNIYPEGPYCGLPEEVFFVTVEGVGKRKVTKTLKWLTFNTRYEVHLVAEYNGKKWSTETFFETPFCYKVSRSFERCLRQKKVPGVPNTTVSPGEILWVVNMTQSTRDPGNNRVRYNITWVSLFNQSSLLYNVTWRDMYSSALGNKSFGSNRSSVTLDLPANSSYEIKVVATYSTTEGDWKIVGEKLFYQDTSMSVTDSPPIQIPSKREPVEPAPGELDGAIIGGTCIATGIIIAFIVFVIYKKRQSFKDVIITKTAVTKSNSYKSSMGYKADYANELLVVTDDWEIDPQQLKFSTPLGQGAFGKVVTGYCDERKVAIKILKDCAPLSYKEDLLAEISLMKKLGTHPNIVSLVGACTLHEPIALIMEYVPYGNLQSFLKKCRQEGELRKRGRRRELTYSMVDAHGSIENGVITPTDILSFARQTVMAMEYLAEKKYVHRDLAARNVLLDYNKVVKVCDFGLSRDIYHDNQYKKLTSGKLPIKWMAVESLRDRVFTTQSDVWSFGILLWEIVTMGASPYPNIALSDLFYMLSNGYRMEKPSNCSDELYSIMRHSWKESPKDRPTFTQLRYYIEDLLTRNCDYLELENIDVPLNNTDSSSLPLSDPFSTSAMASEAEAKAEGRLISVSSGDEVTVDVCVHDKSTDKLLHQTEDSDATVDYRNSKQKRSDTR